MTNESGLGRTWPTLTDEEKLDALRGHALGQELLVRVLLEAIQRLGVTFTRGDHDVPPAAPTEPRGHPPATQRRSRRRGPTAA